MNQFCLNDINYNSPVEDGQVIHTGLYSVEALKILRCLFAYEAGMGYKDTALDTPFHNGRLTAYSTWTSEQNYNFKKSIWSGIGTVARGDQGEVCFVVKSYLWLKEQRHPSVYTIWEAFDHCLAKSLKRLAACLDANFTTDICKAKVYEPLKFRPGCYNPGHAEASPAVQTFKISKLSVKTLLDYFKARAAGREPQGCSRLVGEPLDTFANVLYMKKKAVELKMAKSFIDGYSELKSQQLHDSNAAWMDATASSRKVSWAVAKREYKQFIELQLAEKAEWLKAREAELAAVFPEEN